MRNLNVMLWHWNTQRVLDNMPKAENVATPVHPQTMKYTRIVRLWTLAMLCLLSCYLHGTLHWDMPFYSQNNDRSNMHPTFRIKGKVVHVTAMKVYSENRSIAWHWVRGCVVNFTPQPLYPQGKNPRYPFRRRLGWPQSWSGLFRKENCLLLLLGVEPQTVQFSHCHDYTTLVPFPMASYWQVLTTAVTRFYEKKMSCLCEFRRKEAIWPTCCRLWPK